MYEELKREAIIHALKFIDIGYITVLYFVIGYFVTVYIDKVMGKFDQKSNEAKSTVRLLGEVILHIYIIGLVIYLIRKLVGVIPSPLQGIYGFDHKRVPELSNSYVLTFIIMYFQDNLKTKLDYLAVRLKR